MNIPENVLLQQLENSRKSYQAALIDMRLAEDAARDLQNANGVHKVSSARLQLSAATREYQEALRAFTDFALNQAGKGSNELGAG